MANTCKTKTTCPYCGVGCGIEATVKDNRLIAVTGDASHPANLGKLCVKGTALNETMGEHGRLLAPQIEGVEVNWPTAIKTVAAKLNAIRNQHGPAAIGFYLSGQLLTEDYYVANKLAKGFIGTGNVDTNSRLCMSSAVAGYKRAFGSDAVPCNYEDIDHCDLLIITGSNAAWTHPVLYQRMVAAKNNNPNMKVVVIDPRRTASCDIADLHLSLAPGSDSYLFNGLLNYLSVNKKIDRDYINAHTEGFDEAISATDELNVETVARNSQLNIDDLSTFYKWYADTEKTITFYSMGINQSATGTDKCNAIINCHLATGRIGKLGAGPFSITGQPNAMGGREVGGLANMLAAHMDYSVENVDLVSQFWQSDNVSQQPGLKAIDLFDAVASGEIKAIWIMGTNPVVSMPNADKVKVALENCDTVIVSDCIEHTDTTATANILLPATGWGEKSGTVTNSERCISRQRTLLTAPGTAKDDWWIISQVAQQMGFVEAFSYQSVREVFNEHAALSGYHNNGNRLFNISALSDLTDDDYENFEPQQWPLAESRNKTRLFADGIFNTDSGKGQFVSTVAQLPKQESSSQYPFILNTGRMRDQWHTMTRTARAARLLDHTEQPFAALNTASAKKYNIEQNDLISVSSEYGKIDVIARIDDNMATSELFIPIHWNQQYASNGRVDSLVAPIADAISGQPEFKATPVLLEKITVPRWASIVSHKKIDCSQFIYWSCSHLADNQGYLFQAAVDELFSWQDFIATSSNDSLAYEHFANPTKLDERFICYTEKNLELAIYSHSEQQQLPQRNWLQSLFQKSLLGTSYWSMLTGDEYSQKNSGRNICSCFKVSEEKIINAIYNGADSLPQLGIELKCGTNCGSCIPELNQLIARCSLNGKLLNWA
ncbi:MAG: assimilatory nitrate reductase catalytic subunit [Oceanicoccus sp.]|jgi:assimilatory nitrate reductase catalytic subunit